MKFSGFTSPVWVCIHDGYLLIFSYIIFFIFYEIPEASSRLEDRTIEVYALSEL